MTEAKAEDVISGHVNTYCKEERISLSLTVEWDVCPFMSDQSVNNYAIFTYPVLCLTVAKIYLLLVLDCN